jgi:hypothetical protein
MSIATGLAGTYRFDQLASFRSTKYLTIAASPKRRTRDDKKDFIFRMLPQLRSRTELVMEDVVKLCRECYK